MSTITTTAALRFTPFPVASAPASGLRLSRPVRVGLALSLIFATGLGDLILTLGQMTSVGMFESNPIVAAIATTTGSAAAIALYKILTMTFGCAVLWNFRHHKIAEVGGLLALTAYLATLVTWFLYLQALAGVPLPDGDLAGFVRIG